MVNEHPLTSPRSYLGSGWAFPLRVDGRGRIALVQDERAIARSIWLILSTAKGQRRMRPHFGCGIHELVFAGNDPTTLDLVRHYVTEALTWWEPRITVAEVRVTPDPEEPARLLIDITYFIKATNDERNLVYPFYVIPGEE
jgi:phage baseplate assembly protein W